MDVTGPDASNPRPVWTLTPEEYTTSNIIFGLVALLALAYAVNVARKEQRLYPLYMIIGSGLMVFLEPYCNVLGHVSYPEVPTAWIDTMGRRMPIYLGFGYILYFFAPSLFISRRMRNMTRQKWFGTYAGFIVVCHLFEMIPVHLGLWRYYGGNESLVIGGLPLYWSFINANALFMLAVVMYVIRTRLLTDRTSFLLIPLFPLVAWGSYGAVALPIWSALNSTNSEGVTTAVSLLTAALCILCVWTAGNALPLLRDDSAESGTRSGDTPRAARPEEVLH